MIASRGPNQMCGSAASELIRQRQMLGVKKFGRLAYQILSAYYFLTSAIVSQQRQVAGMCVWPGQPNTSEKI